MAADVTRIQNRRGTTALWASQNTVLASGEYGIETDGQRRIKVGDGVTPWNDLPYSIALDPGGIVNIKSPRYNGSLAAAIEDLANSGENITLELPADWTGNGRDLSGDLTIPANVRLRAHGGTGVIGVGDHALTIEGPHGDPGLVQLFDVGEGRVNYGAFAPDLYRPEWWGAIADFSTPSAAAIQHAIRAAAGKTNRPNREGGVVQLAVGRYALETPDLDVILGVWLRGASVRGTQLTYVGTDAAVKAILTSNIGGSDIDGVTNTNGFLHGAKISDLRVNAADQPVAIWLEGWNEFCRASDVDFAEFTDRGIVIKGAALVANPATVRITQHTGFRNLRGIPRSGARAAFYLENVSRCTFTNLTADQPSTATVPYAIGLELGSAVHQCLFINGHMEDASVGVDVATVGACSANEFHGWNRGNPHAAAATISVGSLVNKTVAFLFRAGAKQHAMYSTRESYGDDVLYYNEDQDETIAGGGGHVQGAVVTLQQIIVASTSAAAGDFFLSDQKLKVPTIVGVSQMLSVNADQTALDVSSIGNGVVRVNTSGGDIAIRGLVGGTDGQTVRFIKTTSANALVFTHQDGSGTEKFNAPNLVDMKLQGYEGFTWVCRSGSWFPSNPRSRNVPALRMGKILRSMHLARITTGVMTADRVYWVYLGQTVEAQTIDYIKFHVTAGGTGAQAAEVALASSASAPDGTAKSLTKIAANGTLSDLTGTGIMQNTVAMGAVVPAGTHLWVGIRTNMASTQPTVEFLGKDMGAGYALATNTAGALTGAGPWTGSIITATNATAAPFMDAYAQ